MNRFKILAFTHKSTELTSLSRLYIEENKLKAKLDAVKNAVPVAEIFYLSTCNRVEFFISTEQETDAGFLQAFFRGLNPDWPDEEVEWTVAHVLIFKGEKALRHLLHVASSLDSLVVGEREIITQVRKAYELCNRNQHTGDLLRLAVKSAIKTAKEIFTQTLIAQRPVSVVSLAYRKLLELNIKLDAKFLIIGSGQTNSTMAKYLLKHGFRHFTVFNRTPKNAEALARELNAKVFSLSALSDYQEGFDVIITCTGSSEPIITKDIFEHLVSRSPQKNTKHTIVDLAIPNDTAKEVVKCFNINYIEVATLKNIAQENLNDRQKELTLAHSLIESNISEFHRKLKERKIELAMQSIPAKVKEINNMAVNSVFAKDIERLDASSKEILDKVVSYLEKKYISVPIKLAKEVLLSEPAN